MKSVTCSATRKDGKRCKMKPLRGSSPLMCFNHSPAAATARQAARRAGGKVRGAQQQLEEDDAEEHDWSALWTPDEIQNALAHVARETIAGKMPAREAAAATTALKALLERAVKDGHRYTD